MHEIDRTRMAIISSEQGFQRDTFTLALTIQMNLMSFLNRKEVATMTSLAERLRRNSTCLPCYKPRF